MRHSYFALLSAFFCLSPAFLSAEDVTALVERFRNATTESSLDTPGLKPWHLLLNFQLLDAKGQPGESGTIEEWWAGPNLHKTVYTSPSYSNTELTNEQGSYKQTANIYPPETLTMAIDQIVHPMPEQVEMDEATPDLRKQEFSKVPLDCVMLDQKIGNLPFPPLGLYPTYCFDRDKTALRMSFGVGSLVIVRNRIGRFQNKEVAIDQLLSIDNKPAMKAHVDKLSGATFTPADFTTDPGMSKVDLQTTKIAGGVIAGSVLHKVTPRYPDRAKRNHVSGKVLLRAIIGTDGRIHRLRLLSSPDPDLALASFAAVREWTYKPYLLNGQPVTVDTTVTVNFAIGP